MSLFCDGTLLPGSSAKRQESLDPQKMDPRVQWVGVFRPPGPFKMEAARVRFSRAGGDPTPDAEGVQQRGLGDRTWRGLHGGGGAALKLLVTGDKGLPATW